LQSRIYERNIIYNHADHLIIHPNGDIYQGFPFSKEIISLTTNEDIKIGNIFSTNDLKPLVEIKYNNLRPCFSNKCDQDCLFKEHQFYSNIDEKHGKMLCNIYTALRRK
jgi:hypothetical protein